MQEQPGANVEREHLRDYLSQYSLAISEKHRLERRLSKLRWDMTHLHGGCPQDAYGKRAGWDKRDGGGMALVAKADEIERMIVEQIAFACDALLCIFDTMDYLPLLSLERAVLEMRYIDLSPWSFISKETGISRSRLFDHHNAGLDLLLAIPEIRVKVAEYIGDT